MLIRASSAGLHTHRRTTSMNFPKIKRMEYVRLGVARCPTGASATPAAGAACRKSGSGLRLRYELCLATFPSLDELLHLSKSTMCVALSCGPHKGRGSTECSTGSSLAQGFLSQLTAQRLHSLRVVVADSGTVKSTPNHPAAACTLEFWSGKHGAKSRDGQQSHGRGAA